MQTIIITRAPDGSYMFVETQPRREATFADSSAARTLDDARAVDGARLGDP